MNATKTRPKPLYVAQVAGVLLLSGMLAMIYTTCWGLAIKNPYAVEYEGHVLWACLQLTKGGNIYDLTALTQDPWSVVIYNPFYFVIGALLLKLFATSFLPLRMLTMTAALVCFFSFGALLKRCRVSDFHMIIAMVMFTACLPVLHWSSVARVDLLGLALSVIALERFVKNWCDTSGGEQPKLSIATVILSTMAFYSKQQYVVFMVATVLFALYKGQKRLALQYMAAYTLLCLAIAALLQAFTGGYWAHLSYAAGLPWEWQTIKLFLFPFLFDAKTLAAVIIIAAATFWHKQASNNLLTRSQSIEALPAILLLCSILPALYTMGLRGAFHNHLLCCEFALFWLGALKLEKLPPNFSTAAIFASAVSLAPLLDFTSAMAFCHGLRADTKETISMLSQSCRDKPLLLTEDPSLAIFAGAKPAMVDATTILNIGALHPGQLDLLLQRLDQKAFGAVIINAHDANEHKEQIWRAPVVKAILKNYSPAGKSGGNGMKQVVFLPNRQL
ncbi:MAG: hypothetical protein C0473_04525 [Cyanobacteria bacterium DS3.002]|nr:hypothetical protein [Cyanobacteria bacterium DS3.002]MBA4076083.1 hypothetical protein [Cyanobacteria bacterium PR.023]